MRNVIRNGVLAGIAIAGLAGASAASAQDADPVSFSGGVTLLTDYRLRGASLSDNEPVIQGVVEAKVPLNDTVSLFAGIWASSLDKDAGAGAMETDIYGGIQARFGDVNVRARYLRLVFHDAENIDFDQYEAGVTAPVGPVTAGLGIIHDQYNGGGHSTYVYSSAAYAIPETGLSVKGLVGYEDGSRWDDKVNWALGAFYTYKSVTFGANYIDTNRFSPNSKGENRAKGAVIFSIGASF